MKRVKRTHDTVVNPADMNQCCKYCGHSILRSAYVIDDVCGVNCRESISLFTMAMSDIIDKRYATGGMKEAEHSSQTRLFNGNPRADQTRTTAIEAMRDVSVFD